MTVPSQSESASIPACTAEACYWKAGLRWEIILQVTYWTSARAGQGPFFVVDHAWRESTAAAKAAAINHRLTRSQGEAAQRDDGSVSRPQR